MLLWLKRAINAAAFAGGAAQMNGPGDAAWSPWSVENLLSAANRANEPGRYNAYRKLVEEKLGMLDPFTKDYLIDQMMHPEAYRSSGKQEKSKGWLGRNLGVVGEWAEDIGDGFKEAAVEFYHFVGDLYEAGKSVASGFTYLPEYKSGMVNGYIAAEREGKHAQFLGNAMLDGATFGLKPLAESFVEGAETGDFTGFRKALGGFAFNAALGKVTGGFGKGGKSNPLAGKVRGEYTPLGNKANGFGSRNTIAGEPGAGVGATPVGRQVGGKTLVDNGGGPLGGKATGPLGEKGVQSPAGRSLLENQGKPLGHLSPNPELTSNWRGKGKGYKTETVLPNGDRIVVGPNGDRWHVPKNKRNKDAAAEAKKDAKNTDLSKRIGERAGELADDFNRNANRRPLDYMSKEERNHLRDLKKRIKEAHEEGDKDLVGKLKKQYNLDRARIRGKYVHKQLENEFPELSWKRRGVDAQTGIGVNYEVLRDTEGSIIQHGTRKGMTNSIWKMIVY